MQQVTEKKKTRDAQATRDAIFSAAIRHFANFGYEGAHVRKMLVDADVNMSLAHYYFGSKQALFEAVIDHFVEPVLEDRARRLESWRKSNGDLDSRLVELLSAYALPHFIVSASSEGHHYARLMVRVLSSGDHLDMAIIDAAYELRREYIAELQQLFPNLDAEKIEFAMNSLVSVMLLESPRMAVQDEVDVSDAEMSARRVARIIAGGLGALAET